jgi:hypothetical protein
MTTCLKPCILFSAFALLLEIVLIVWLGDIVKDSENYVRKITYEIVNKVEI